MKSLLPFVWVTLLACSGKAIVDGPGAGGGGNGGSSSSRASTGVAGDATVGPSTSSGGTDCMSLGEALRQKIATATACNACSDFDACFDGPTIFDQCGCRIGAISTDPLAVQRAQEAYDAWVAAGCGPLDCGMPCFERGQWYCSPGSNGSCDGSCAPSPGG